MLRVIEPAETESASAISEEDQAFVVEVPELPGCIADGETYEQAVADAQRVIEEWIETARELGREIPEPKGRLMYASQRGLCTGVSLPEVVPWLCASADTKKRGAAFAREW